MCYLDYFLLFGGLVSMIYLYGSSCLQRDQLKKRFLNPENREAILKESFYDESEKQRNLRDIRKVETGLYEAVKKLFMQGVGISNSDLEKELMYVKELKLEIETDMYVHQLAVIPAEERSLDNWDDF